MTLSQKQRAFAKAITILEHWMTVMGYEWTHGDSYRDPRVHGAYGEKASYSGRYSLHKMRLARDYNLFIDGKYQRTTEAFKPIGEFWVALGPHVGMELTWGGTGGNDGNHFSCSHGGRW